MIREQEQRSDRAVRYSLSMDENTLTVSVDGVTTEYTFPAGDGYMADPPFPIVKAERRDGSLAVEVIRTVDERGEPIESESGTPTAGTVDWQPLPMSTLAEVRPDALSAIDHKAGEVRREYLTDVTGQEGTYLEKRREAQAFAAAGYPEGDLVDYPWIQAKADALGGTTGQQAADTILATAGQWTGTIGPAIERERENGKRLINEATDVAGVETERDAALAALEALKPG